MVVKISRKMNIQCMRDIYIYISGDIIQIILARNSFLIVFKNILLEYNATM